MTISLKRTSARAPVHDKITLPYPVFQDTDAIEWRRWVMEGVDYKLLSIDRRTNGFTCLLRVQPGYEAPVHQHLGAIELIVLEGDICYDECQMGRSGDYMFEPAGDIHQPRSPSGCVLFCVFYGAIAGLADDGSVAGIVDAKAMLAMAEHDGVAAHVHQ